MCGGGIEVWWWWGFSKRGGWCCLGEEVGGCCGRFLFETASIIRVHTRCRLLLFVLECFVGVCPSS